MSSPGDCGGVMTSSMIVRRLMTSMAITYAIEFPVSGAMCPPLAPISQRPPDGPSSLFRTTVVYDTTSKTALA